MTNRLVRALGGVALGGVLACAGPVQAFLPDGHEVEALSNRIASGSEGDYSQSLDVTNVAPSWGRTRRFVYVDEDGP